MYKDRISVISLSIFLLALGAALQIRSPQFYSQRNLLDLLSTASAFLIVGIGAMLVIMTGNIDISAGPIFSSTAVIAAALSKHGFNPIAVIAITILLGSIFGLINALLVTVLNLPSIIATLGTSSLFGGGLIYLTGGGAWIVDLPKNFTNLGQGKMFAIPLPIWFALTIAILAYLATNYSKFGRYFYAVGSHKESARLAGINTRRVEGSAFVVNAALIALAASLTAARMGQAQSNFGANVTLSAITIAVVGGCSVFGGTGTVPGILLATILVQVSSSALTFFHIDPLWTQSIQGGFILISVSAVAIRRTDGAFR